LFRLRSCSDCSKVALLTFHVWIYTELKKDPGIPNLWPFKDQLLQKAQQYKVRIEEEKEKQKKDNKQKKK
jgi:hypothetical protein